MKSSLGASAALHILLIAAGMVSLSSPRKMEVVSTESLPVDIVPIEELTQIQQGDKKAPLKEKASPAPTKKQDIAENAQETGDNALDLKTPPTPEARPKEVKTAAIPEPAPEPKVKPDDSAEKAAKAAEAKAAKAAEAKAAEAKAAKAAEAKAAEAAKAEKAAEAAATKAETEALIKKAEAEAAAEEKAAEAKAAKEAKAKADTKAKADAKAETEALIKKAEADAEAEAKAAEAKAAKEAKAKAAKDAKAKAAKEAAAKAKSEEKKFDADEVAALLNKEKASGGGAKRSQKEASLGGKKTTGGAALSQNEMDALRGQIEKCWNVPAGVADAEGLKISVKFKLTPEGEIDGRPEIVSGGSDSVARAAGESARRAVMKCAPYNLPAEKYDSWADVIVNFDPSEMF